ncbi:hypothetical protein FRC09_014298 [Ceratobasidium sp. 395]|nr:hypothetical protein FRC09_014298 [Ceratobasidium sp. 395]
MAENDADADAEYNADMTDTKNISLETEEFLGYDNCCVFDGDIDSANGMECAYPIGDTEMGRAEPVGLMCNATLSHGSMDVDD